MTQALLLESLAHQKALILPPRPNKNGNQTPISITSPPRTPAKLTPYESPVPAAQLLSCSAARRIFGFGFLQIRCTLGFCPRGSWGTVLSFALRRPTSVGLPPVARRGYSSEASSDTRHTPPALAQRRSQPAPEPTVCAYSCDSAREEPGALRLGLDALKQATGTPASRL